MLILAGGAFDVALETAEVIAPVMAEIHALSAAGGIMDVFPYFASSFPSASVVIVARGIIQPL